MTITAPKTVTLDITTPAGINSNFDVSTELLKDPLLPFNIFRMTNRFAPAGRRMITQNHAALVAAALVAGLEVRSKYTPVPKAADVTDAAKKRFADACDYIDLAITLEDFAYEVAQSLKDTLIYQDALDGFRDSLEDLGYDPNTLSRISDDFRLVDTDLVIPGDITAAFTSILSIHIDCGLENFIRQRVIYEKLRGEGHTVDEIGVAIAEAVSKL